MELIRDQAFPIKVVESCRSESGNSRENRIVKEAKKSSFVTREARRR